MHRTRTAKLAAVGLATIALAVSTAGAASAQSANAAPSTDASPSVAACPSGTVPFQTNAATVPLFRHVGPALPRGHMERTGGYFGGNFCAFLSFTDSQGVEYLSRHDASTWIRASDAHRR